MRLVVATFQLLPMDANGRVERVVDIRQRRLHAKREEHAEAQDDAHGEHSAPAHDAVRSRTRSHTRKSSQPLRQEVGSQHPRAFSAYGIFEESQRRRCPVAPEALRMARDNQIRKMNQRVVLRYIRVPPRTSLT